MHHLTSDDLFYSIFLMFIHSINIYESTTMS